MNDILVFTDNHYSQYGSIVRGRGPKWSVRIHNQIDSLNWVTKLAEERKCKAIVCEGDFFDKPELNAEELTALQEVNWSKTIPYYFIVGNHEMGLNDLSVSSAHLLKMIPNAKIIDKPYYESGFGYRLIFLPYVLEGDRQPISTYIKEAIGDSWETQEVKKTIIFSHNDIAGIRYGQWESKAGFDIDDIYNNCDLFINGHLHNQMQINDKILNLGNLTGQNFSEDAEKYSHCAAIVNTDTLSVDLINNPHALCFYKLEIYNDKDLNKLDKCKENAVLSIKTKQSFIANLKSRLLEHSNIVAYRIVTIPEINSNITDDIKQILKLDHIDQFKTYVRELIDNSSLLEEELSVIL